MKRLLFCLAVLLVHSVHAENPAQPVLRVNRMKATNNSGGKIELDSNLFFKNDADKVDFADYIGVGSGASVPSVGGNSGKWLTNNGTSAFWSALPSTDVTLTGLDGLTGGGGTKLDGVSVAALPVGTVVSFEIGTVHYFYVLSDDGDLPAEDGLNFILPDSASGTKYWAFLSSMDRNGANGERFLSFGPAETYMGTLYPQAYGYVQTQTFAGSALNFTPTWDGVGQTFTLLRARVTDTNSAAGSLLLDLGTNASKVSVDKSGNMILSTSISVPTVTGTTTVDGGRHVVTGTAGAGYLELPTQSSNPSIVASKIRIWSAQGPGTNSSLFVNYDDGGAPAVPSITFVSANGGSRAYTFPSSATALMQFDSDLNALANNSANGFWAHISAGSGSARTLIAGSSKISITNGDGVAGNPTFDLVEANLTFTDSTPIVKGSGDATKKLRFEVDGFTTGTTRVVTFPNADFTIAGPTAARTMTVPDANFTAARTDAANTFSGTQTFTGAMTNTTSGIAINLSPSAGGTFTASPAGAALLSSASGTTVSSTSSATTLITSAATTTIENTGSGSVVFRTGAQTRFSISSSGHLVPNADNTFDVGATSAALREAFTRSVDSGSANDLVLQRNNVTGLTIAAAANISALPVRLKGYTVAGLPTGTQGDLAYVTDANAPTYNATVAGGGAVVIPVFYNGTNWVCH